MSDQDLRRKLGVGRPSVLPDELRGEIDSLLAEDPAMKGVEVLRRLRSEHHYAAGKNPVYDYVKAVRPPKAAAPVVRFEGVAGEFCQHDFGKSTLHYLDGTSEKITFYAARLKYSRMMHVCLVEGESAEMLIRGMESAARAFQGLALINVIDNTKAAVIRRERNPDTRETAAVWLFPERAEPVRRTDLSRFRESERGRRESGALLQGRLLPGPPLPQPR